MCTSKILWSSLLAVVWLFHLLVIIGMTMACFLSLVYEPWYIAMTTITFAVFLATKEDICILTKIENQLRTKIGLQVIDTFSNYYLVRRLKGG